MRSMPIVLLLVIILFLSGCSLLRAPGAPDNSPTFTLRGGLYSHTVQPLTVNREATDVKNSEMEGKGRITQINYPLTSVLSVRVGNNGIGQVAKEHGMTTIYYADLEQWSALFGLWSTEIVHIYGR
jgi:hypothetical protein